MLTYESLGRLGNSEVITGSYARGANRIAVPDGRWLVANLTASAAVKIAGARTAQTIDGPKSIAVSAYDAWECMMVRIA